MEKGAIRYMWGWSKPYIARYKIQFLFALFLMLAFVALNLFQVNFIQSSIDAALIKDWASLIRILILFVTVTILRIMRDYLYGYTVGSIDANMAKDIKTDLTQAVLDVEMSFISEKTSGGLITNYQNDIQTALEFVKDGYANFLLNPLVAVSGFIYLLFFNWKLSVCVFLSTPILSVLLNIMSGRASRIHKQKLERHEVFMENVHDAVHGAETIKTCNMQTYLLKKAEPILREIYHSEVRYGFNDAVTVGLILAVTYVPSIVALIYGGILAMRGEISVSVLFAYSQLIPTVNTPTINIFSSLNAMKKSYQSMKRLDAIFSAKRERKDGFAHLPAAGMPSVEFDSVQFSYGQAIPVLGNISLQLREGKCIGLMGDSGSGKSTIVNLICGFYPADRGTVLLFGYDISAWNLEALRANIAYVSQQSDILPGTVFENIQYGRLNASKEEVIHAADKAGVLSFTESLPLELNTPLHEGGSNLSGGQRQRVGLARAFLRDAPLFIFDEPTSSLDPETEKLVMDSLAEIAKEKSVIIISHKPSTLKICDVIYHLRNGAVEIQ